jgi:regulator of protease activity HflC (stomatin/prohibitin superfamily)
MKKGTIGAAFFGLILIVGVICGFACIDKIPTGYVGVVYSPMSGVDDEYLTEGWHFVAPQKKVTEYSIGIEQSYLTADDKGDSRDDESFATPTADGKSLKVDLEFSYKFDQSVICDTFTMFKGQSGSTVKDTFIKPKIKAWTQEVTAQYPVTDVFGDKRQELNEALDIYLKEKFAPYGIVIDTVNFTSITVDAETEAAIQKKVNAQQELELAQIESQTAQVQAEKDKKVALVQAEKDKETAIINAEKAKIKAEGEAEALRIAAEAEAEANREIAASLTPELIDKIKYEKWNGAVSQVSGSAIPFIDLTE